MQRRALLVCGLSASLLLPPTKKANAISLVDLSGLGKSLGDAAEAVGKLGDSIAHIVGLGSKGWSSVSASKTRTRLLDLSARLTEVSISQTHNVVDNLDDYISSWRKATQSGNLPLSYIDKQSLEASWHGNVQPKLRAILERVPILLSDLQKERSDFVAQDAYFGLMQAMSSRSSLLMKLADVSPPLSINEVAALDDIAVKYRLLVENLRKAIQSLNAYLVLTQTK